jgi:DNA-directed RNA polymerase specialized sigma24 family protein
MDLEAFPEDDAPADDLIGVQKAIARIAGIDEQAAALVKRRRFAGLKIEHSSSALGISSRTVERDWTFARM